MRFKPSRLQGMTRKEAEVMFKEPSRTEKPRDGRFTPPSGRLPKGYMYVWNRLDRPFEKFYDHKVHVWQPHEFLVYPEDIARWLYGHTVLTEDSIGGARQTALAIEGEPGWLEPLDKFDPVEYLDRSTDDNPQGWGTGGLKTQAKVLGVRGASPRNFPNYK